MQRKKHNPTWEHIKLTIWVILIFELLLFSLALAVDNRTGFAFAFRVSLWLGLVMAVVFLSILVLNLCGIIVFPFVERLHAAVFDRSAAGRDAVNFYDIPELKSILRGAHHVDIKTVQGRVGLAEFIAAMLSFRPPWLVFCYRIRKVLVLFLGMQQDDGPGILPPLGAQDIPFKPGQNAAFFIVRHAQKDRYWIAETPDEKHLRAFFVIFRQPMNQRENRFHVMTVVHYKHWTGPVYFNIIRPFHHLVVRQMALAGAKANQAEA